MKGTRLADKIWYFEDVIANPKDTFDKLILSEDTDGWREVPNAPFMETLIDTTRHFLQETDNSTFRCLDVWYREETDLNYQDYKITKTTAYYTRNAGGGYGPHSDFASSANGTYEEVQATVLGYFSDPEDFEGGEIYFDDYDIEIKPKAGSMIVFGHQVQHGVRPVLSGTRNISSQFLVTNKAFWNIAGVDESTLSKQDRIVWRKTAPQWEPKAWLASQADKPNAVGKP